MILNPNCWGQYPNRVNLSWNMVKFTPDDVLRVPNTTCGVYSFVVIPGIANHISCSYLLYVGKTTRNFRQRYQEYLRDQSQPRKRPHVFEMLNKWKEHLWFCYATIRQVDIIGDIENDLLAAYLPPYNKEFPAEIREPMKVLR